MSLEEMQALEREHVVPAYARMPVQFVRGEGSRLWDAAGDEYLDLQTGLAVTSLGHCHPAVVAAIREQAAQLVHVGNLFYTAPGMRLAKRLADGSLGGKVHFANSGTEANEAALKLARKAKQGGTIISVHRGFHGRTYGSLSATPQEAKQAPFAPLVPGFHAVAPTAEAIAAAVDERTAAVILEPVQGESGVWVLDDDVLHAARAACDEHRAALIFDEVQCGLGRTGTLWAYEDAGVVPDMITSAKALGGGLPIGALICGPAYADVLAPGDHGSTFAGGLVPCAAAHAVLDVVEDPELLARVRALGARLTAELAQLPGVAAVRGRGLMLACDLADGGAPELVRRALLEQRLVHQRDRPGDVPAAAGADDLRRGGRRGARAAARPAERIGPSEQSSPGSGRIGRLRRPFGTPGSTGEVVATVERAVLGGQVGLDVLDQRLAVQDVTPLVQALGELVGTHAQLLRDLDAELRRTARDEGAATAQRARRRVLVHLDVALDRLDIQLVDRLVELLGHRGDVLQQLVGQ